MDTPESPTQSPQSPEDEEKGLSDSELLESPESPAEEDNGVSDSELLNDEEGGGGDSDFDDEDRVEVGRRAPEEISDPEDDKVDRDAEREMHLQERTVSLLECGPHGRGTSEHEGEEILETPRSPDPDSPEPEQERSFTPAEEEQEDGRRDEEEEDGGETGGSLGMSHQELDEDDDEEEERRRRRVMAISDLKDESSSVSRELDEHELDYDEEVLEEPNTTVPEEEDVEKGPGVDDGEADEEKDEDEEEEEGKRKKDERNPGLLPDSEPTKSEEPRGQERIRRDSFRDKKKDEDDGEIDEGEIDVSVLILIILGFLF